MQTPTVRPWLTSEQVAERTGFTPATIQRFAREGRIPYRRIGRWIRFEPEVIDELGRVPSQPAA
jgi:excisionase family DNA binding protein